MSSVTFIDGPPGFQPIENVSPTDVANFEKQLHETEKQLLDHAFQLKGLERINAINHIQRIVGGIRKQVADMVNMGLTFTKFEIETGRLLTQLSSSAQQFFESCESYQQQKKGLANEFSRVNGLFLSTSLPSYAPFAPTQVNQMTDQMVDQFRATRFFPQSRDEKPEPKERQQKSPEQGLDSFLPGVSEMPPAMGDMIQGKTIQAIEHRYGKPQAAFAEWVSHTFKSVVSEESQSPWRDRMITAAVHVGMTEVVALCLPHRVPAYVAMTGIHAVAEGARLVTPSMDKLANDLEVAFPGYYRGRDDIEETQAALAFAQIPSDCLHAIHHTITEAVAHLSDKIGLTDKHIADITKHSLEFIAQNSPELLEERMWAKAREDVERRKQD